MKTVVKKWFRDKGFGFLENGNGPDIFVHEADIANGHFLIAGSEVTFECHQGEKGLMAKAVKIQKQSHKAGQDNRNGQQRNNRGSRHYDSDRQPNYNENQPRHNGQRQQPFIGVMT